MATTERASQVITVEMLREETRDILRQVEEEGETFEVVDKGRVVAQLGPSERPQATPEEIEAWLAEWRRLGQEISARWPKGVSAVDAVRDVRRGL